MWRKISHLGWNLSDQILLIWIHETHRLTFKFNLPKHGTLSKKKIRQLKGSNSQGADRIHSQGLKRLLQDLNVFITTYNHQQKFLILTWKDEVICTVHSEKHPGKYNSLFFFFFRAETGTWNKQIRKASEFGFPSSRLVQIRAFRVPISLVHMT